MIKFKIKVSHVFSELLDVEAADEAEAKKLAEERVKVSGRSFTPTYEVTFPPDQWAIVTEEQYKAMIEEALAKKEKEKNNK